MKRVAELIEYWDLVEESSLAAKQAKALNLRHAGFGKWKDSTGKVTHVTKDGKLVRVAEKTVIDAKSFDWGKALTDLIKASEGNKYHHVLVNSNDPREVEIANAITLWTNGSIKTVRNPSNFDATHEGATVDNRTIIDKENYGPDGKPKTFTKDLGGLKISSWKVWSIPNTKAAYKKANIIMERLASAKWEGSGESLCRGMLINNSELSSIAVGAEFDVGSVASFSKGIEPSHDFALSMEPDVSTGVILTIKPNKIKRGTSIHDVSHYTNEREVVSSGKHSITKVTKGWSRDKFMGKESPVIYVEVEQL